MDIEERLQGLEHRVATLDRKRIDLRNEVIALRMLVATTLPVIASSAGVELSGAIADAARQTHDALLLAGYDVEANEAVLEAIDVLGDELTYPVGWPTPAQRPGA